MIIDEAQHLEAEVLEQLRLLTNLETDTKKLLQVILIGQPELQQLLIRRDLRQLAQRITARYHLLPLNQQELASYIKHRLSVADCHRALFNKSAITTIHALSQGIPRLINLLCHSALMEAYNSNNAVVDKKIVLRAASHALGDDFEQVIWWQNKSIQIASAASVLLAVLVTGFWLGDKEHSQQQMNVISNEVSKAPLPIETSESLEEKSTQSKEKKIVQPKEVQQLLVSSDKGKLLQTTKAEPAVVEPINVETSISSSQTVEEIPASPAKQDSYQIEAVDGVSDDLLARFQNAIDDTKDSATNQEELINSHSEGNEIKSITQMPTWVQEGLPSLRFEQHIYSSDGEGWVNVNGRDRYEGDSIANGLTIDKILPQQVILTYRGEQFSLPALTNW